MYLGNAANPAPKPKKQKQAVLSFSPQSGQLQILRNESSTADKEPWEKYLVPNPHSKKLKFFNSIVRQIYESAFCHKQTGFKNYLLEQQQMRWKLNKQIDDLSHKANNLLKNEKYGVCQNIKKFLTETGSFNSSDVSKCESCLNTVNITLNSASELKSLIDSKRQKLFFEDHSLKPFASDELKYIEDGKRQVIALHEELQSTSTNLTTTHTGLLRRFPSCVQKSTKSRRKKENRRKVRRTKEKRLQQRAHTLLGNLSSIEIANKIFESLGDGSFKERSVGSINASFTAKLTKHFHLDPLLWLIEKDIFSESVTKNLQEVLSILKASGPRECSDSNDSNDDNSELEVAETDNEAEPNDDVDSSNE